MHLLGIETSCDETALAVVEAEGGFERPHFHVLRNLVFSQIALHAPYGGVVPNLAKRAHREMLQELRRQVGSLGDVDAIAVTVGPGLEPCLWEGITFAQALMRELRKSVVAVNHMEGHIASVLLGQDRGMQKSKAKSSKQIQFPALILLVSGGHTELVWMKRWLHYEILGETKDDAVGEAFDKVARLLGLPYPGGPEISRLAEESRSQLGSLASKRTALALPSPMLRSRDLNFSFSGLKTAVLYSLRKNPRLNKADVARAFEDAAVEVLVVKTLKAAAAKKPKTIIVAGGVAANAHLRAELAHHLEAKLPNFERRLLFPDPAFTGDNAAMIAAAGYFRALKKNFAKPTELKAEGRLSIEPQKR